MAGLMAQAKTLFVLGRLVTGPKMAQNSVTDLGLLKNGFSRNSSLKPKIFDVVPVNGPTGRGWPLPQPPKPK